MTRTCVAQVVSLACAHRVPCVVSVRPCCVFDSLRLLHFPLSAVHLLSYRPVFPPRHQTHLPRCGGQIPCALPPMRTLALLPSTTLSQDLASQRWYRWFRGGEGSRFDSFSMAFRWLAATWAVSVDKTHTLQACTCTRTSLRKVSDALTPVVHTGEQQAAGSCTSTHALTAEVSGCGHLVASEPDVVQKWQSSLGYFNGLLLSTGIVGMWMLEQSVVVEFREFLLDSPWHRTALSWDID